VEKSELWNIAHKLVGFDTVSSRSNREATDYLANYLEEIGFTVHEIVEDIQGVQKVMLVAWIGPEVPDGLIISSHTDVVPFDGQPGWQTNPLEMTLKGERIIGRGVSDMKVFIAQALLAAKQQTQGQLKRPLVYLFTCDEEIAGREGQGSERLAKVLSSYFQKFPLPTIALIGEPTNNAIFHVHKGYTTFTIRVLGKGGHSSTPQHGINAIDVMTDVLHIVREFGLTLQKHALAENKVLFPDNPASTFNTGLIQGGLAPNMIADSCEVTISIRVTPGDNAQDLINILQKQVNVEIVSELKRKSGDSDVFFDHLISTPPLHSPPNGVFVDLLTSVYGKQILGCAPYATDGGQFQRLNINSYICGPGLLEQAHQPNESISVQNFMNGTAKISKVIQHWCINP
jgi:acetylornithine deacetylase